MALGKSFSLDLLLNALAQRDIGQGNRRYALVLAFFDFDPTGQVKHNPGIFFMSMMPDVVEGERRGGSTSRGSFFCQQNVRRECLIGQDRARGRFGCRYRLRNSPPKGHVTYQGKGKNVFHES